MSLLARYDIASPRFFLLGGVTCAAMTVIFFNLMPSTYATFLTAAMMAPFAMSIAGGAKRFLLAALTMSLPITVTITLGGNPDHLSGATGYIISVFDIVLAVLYLLWFVEIVKGKREKIAFIPSVSIPALILIGIAALSIAYSRFPSLGIYELVEVIKMYLCFLYLANNIRSKSEVQFVVAFLLLGLLLEGIIGFAQHHYGEPFWPSALGGSQRVGDRIMGTWRSPNDCAWYLALILPLAFSLPFFEMRLAYKLLCGIIFLLGGGSLLLTNSRGGWIGLIVGIVFVSVFVFGKIRGKLGLIKAFASMMALVICLSPLYPKLMTKIYARFVSDDRGSAESRLLQFPVAYDMIKDNMLTGVGLNNFTEVMYDYDTTDEGLRSLTPHAVHNIFLHIAAETGVFGVAIFLCFILIIFLEGIWYVMSNEGFMAYTVVGMLGGILTFLVHGMVDTATLGSKLYVFLWFFSGVIFAIKNIEPTPSISL